MLNRSLRTALYRLKTLGGYPGLEPEFSTDVFIQDEEPQGQSNVLLIPDVHEQSIARQSMTLLRSLTSSKLDLKRVNLANKQSRGNF